MAGSRGYLGKISAIITADSRGLSRALQAGAKETRQFAGTLDREIKGAVSRAARSFNDIYTPIQKLERALKVGVGQGLRIVRQQDVQAIKQFTEATERIGRPLASAVKGFAGLSREVRAGFQPALESAQKAAEQLRASIGAGARISERDFANVESRVRSVTQAIGRLTEASQAVRGLASGSELRFQDPGFLREVERAGSLQRQAAELTPAQISDGGIASIVTRQRQAADEAERWRAVLERARLSRTADAAAAEEAYARQQVRLRLISDELENQIALQRRAAAERERGFTVSAAPRQSSGIGLFGSQAGTAEERALTRARELDAAFQRLPRAAQAGLAGLAGIASRLANGLQEGTASAAQLEAVLERLGPAIAQAGQADAQTNRITALVEAWDRGVRGIGNNVAELDQRFMQLMGRIENLSIDDRLDLDPAIRGFVEAARAGEGYAALLQRLLPLEERVGQRERRGPLTFLPPGGGDEPLGPGRDVLSPSTQLPPDRARNRILQNLGGEIDVIRRRIGELPDVAATLGPIVDNLTIRFQNLGRAGIGFSANQARELQQETRAVAAALNNRAALADRALEGSGGAGAAGLQLGIDQRALRGLGGELEFLQDRLARVGAEARGPTVAAMEQYRRVTVQAFRDGSASTEAGRRRIAEAREEVVRLAAAVLNVRPGRLAQQLARVGDVARGGFGNAGLAIQQAAFAVEDFFSVTGGLDQRIRAAGNNLSQLGFIAGGTAGLIAGISAAIGSQLVVALIKWVNNGRAAEDTTKALNDALARQKSLVEELTQAFSTLGDTIARRAFSQPAQEARAFRKEIEEIAKKQRELREERVLSLDEGVIRARADVNVAQNALGRATTREQSVDAQRRLAEARARLAQEEARVRDRGEAPVAERPADVARAAAQSVDVLFERAAAAAARSAAVRQARVNAATGNDDPGAVAAAAQAAQEEGNARRRRAAELLAGSTDPREVRSRIATLQREAGQRGDTALQAQLAELFAALELPARRAADEAVRNLLVASSRAAAELEAAQGQVADAIRAGIPDAAILRGVLDAFAAEIDKAQQEIADAQRDVIEGRRTQESADARTADAQARIDAARAAREQALIRADALERRRIVDPQSLTESRIQRAQSNLQGAGLESGILARQLRELELRRVQADRLANSNDPLQRGIGSRELEAINQEAAALEAATAQVRRFTEALDRATQEAQRNLDSARQREDDIRRQSLAPQSAASPTAADRDRARRNAEEQQTANRRVEEAVAQERDRLERNAQNPNDPLTETFRRLQEIDEQLASGTGSQRERDRLIEERRGLEEQVDAQVNDSLGVRLARDKSTRVEERQRAEERGLELSRTPAERARREASQQASDIRAALEGNLIQPNRAQAAFNQLLQDQAQQAAPLVMGFREERLNAMLQGPSRAALNVADTRTMEGQRELNRLLRGDDANKDVNLVELQKQTDKLQEVIDAIREQAGNAVVELRG